MCCMSNYKIQFISSSFFILFITSLTKTKQTIDCGINTETLEFRIVGGREADSGEFPWQVSLVVNRAHFCGASIISNEWILTAAHCLDNWKLRNGSFTVIAGSIFRLRASKYRSEHKPIKVVIHPRYNKALTSNDVAVVKVKPEFQFRNHSSEGLRAIGSVCLPLRGEEFVNRKAIVSGFGRRKHNSVLATRLMAVKLNVLRNRACLSVYKTPKYKTNSNVCYGTRKGRKGSCKGDSGGPVTVIDKNRVKQIAIVSYGMLRCASAPSVGAKVSYFRNWIKAKTGI